MTSLHVTCTITCAVFSESVVGSLANFLRIIPHSLSCFCRATRTPDCTKCRPISLVEKPQKEFYFCEAQRTIAHSCQVAGNLRDAIIFEPWIGLHEDATSAWQVSLFTLPYCEDDVTVWQRVSVHAAVQSDEEGPLPLALHQHDQVFCAHWGALAGNIAHLQYAHRHRFWCTDEIEAISPATLNIAINIFSISILLNTP